MIFALALLPPACFIAIILTIALRRAMGDMLPALSASAILMGVALRLAGVFPPGDPWPLALVVLGGHALAFLAIRQADRRRS